MSTSSKPGGRQSAAVYRRRRIVVGLALLAVIIAIVLLFVRPGSGDEKPGGPSSSSTPSETTDPSTTPDASAPPSGEAGAPCDPAAISVVAATDQVDYESGVPVSMTMTVTNTGAVNCELNVGTAAQVFTVTSGEQQYWTSTDCQTDPADAKVLLEPGVPASSTTPVVWDRTLSTPENCDAEREAAPAGGASYHLTVSIAGIASEPTQFLLY